MAKTKIAIFEGKKIRRHWDKKQEKWYFSVVDVVQILTNQLDFIKSRKYWNKLAERLRKEGSEVVTKCHRLKLEAADGKKYLTDVADVETLFRLIQSVPSPKAEGLQKMPERSWSKKQERKLLAVKILNYSTIRISQINKCLQAACQNIKKYLSVQFKS